MMPVGSGLCSIRRSKTGKVRRQFAQSLPYGRFGEANDLRDQFSAAFLAIALVGALATVVVLRLHPSAGEVLTAED
jgi:hypothetical protein